MTFTLHKEWRRLISKCMSLTRAVITDQHEGHDINWLVNEVLDTFHKLISVVIEKFKD